MPIFLDTRGNTSLGIAVCGRCGIKFPIGELSDDPNYPGLRVCSYDKDNLDPWRLPARESDRITLDYPRPDLQLTTEAPSPIFQVNPVYGVTDVGFAQPWQRLTPYAKSASVTPLDVDLESVPLPQYWFVCIVGGVSGAVAPKWPSKAGVILTEGTVTWLCLGIFPN